MQKLLQWFSQRVENTGAPYVVFGIFGIINYPVCYVMFQSVVPQEYNPFSFRLIAGILCVPLALKNYWPQKLRNFLPLYWYLTILYCLPFFGAYMLLMNNASDEWLMNKVLGLFLLILIVDWLMFILLLIVGVSLAFILYLFSTPPNGAVSADGIYLAAYMYFLTILIGAIFSRDKEKIAYEKLQAMRSLAANIAHELRTPLAAIASGARGIKHYLPSLINTYALAKKENLDIPIIREKQIDALKNALTYIETEINFSNTIINMLLVNVKEFEIQPQEFEICSIVDCVNKGLERYPFAADEVNLVHWQANKDFKFKGKEILTIHILFNLIKNALYYIKAATKGHIEIWVDEEKQYNTLHFRDTGAGINTKILPNIFNRFFSKTNHGYGVGLAFCKMVMTSYRGDILCYSVEGEFSEFVLKFPKIEPDTL